MLLKSSSTPVLGSLLSSFTDSPSHSIHPEASHAHKHLPPKCVPQHHHHSRKLSFHQTGSFYLSPFSCNSSPISPSIADLERQNKGVRRAQSEGNLQALAYASYNNNSKENDTATDPPCKFSVRPKCLTLLAIPSSSFCGYKGMLEEDEEEESDIEYGEEREELEEEKRATEGRGDGFSLQNRGHGIVLTEEVRVKDGICRVSIGDQEDAGVEEMYLAVGLGIDACGDGIGGCRGGRGGSGGGDCNSMGSGGDDGDRFQVEEYYKRMVEENPGNPLFLRNYAQFLYQCKRDPRGAEEYYSRAILADPKDGEVLSQYGKLVWELHQDQDRASSYFERAVRASPEDSHVHAAYASFLWNTEEDEDGCNEPQCLPPQFHQGAMATAGA